MRKHIHSKDEKSSTVKRDIDSGRTGWHHLHIDIADIGEDN